MALTSGTRLGPYEVVEPLGSGGMGEVYRARDPRLGREVAVKLVATEGEPSPDRLRRFETEARAAAALSHPNVVTVHDVGTHEGRPYLVLELLEGQTLREALRGGVPALRQAVAWALEVARGLGAAHERGIVHRDLKPENVFLTTDGRVKVLDFGLAKLHEPLVSDEADRESPTATRDTSPGVLLGTIGYMSPEQVKGETPDPRTDVFALGTVLYEMVTGRRAFGGGTAPEVLASILRDEPPALESVVHGIPVSLETVVRRCLGKHRSERFSSARELAGALEAVLASLQPTRATVGRPQEPRGPYPGLSAFTEADAGRFFGREAEVESLWSKLRQRKLLALIGPSGAGKTSFVRAGLAPSRPSGWGALVATPGGAPMRALAEALVEELPSDADTMKQLLGFDDPEVAFRVVRKWRESHLEAVLVVDQFEELFTLNPREVQERFAGLLGRLAGEGDVHVLLSLRDDFLIRCHEHRPLEAVFQNLTPILALGGDDLRRALTEPAKREGYAFEDEGLVAEMLESLEGARGALPLLAFAVARLWEKRDRERKLLTRRAYEETGGVAGSLAQHAEQTLERIGLDKEPIVRELFRNLVTAQWTRAVADREQLLSVCPKREAAGQVLDALVDARLLTSYEIREDAAGREGEADPAPRQRIEIVHESLLRAWPRLVRWQAQDEEGAVLRDQLKQAARLWEEKRRSPDLLWSGTAFQEYQLWRGRYPGALTAVEEDFATAMADQAARRRRRRRLLAGSVVTAALLVAAITGALWRRSEAAGERARAEALRAEAGKLLALGRNQLETDTTAALAHARASLSLFDTPEARRFVLETLWQGPVARLLPQDQLEQQLGLPRDPEGITKVVLSPDGRWLAFALGPYLQPHQILLLDRDGGPPRALPLPPDGTVNVVAFGPRSDLLIIGGSGRNLRLLSLPDLKEIRTVPLAGMFTHWGWLRGDTLLLNSATSFEGGVSGVIQALPLPDGELRTVGINRSGESVSQIDPSGTLLTFKLGGSFGVRSLDGGHEQILGPADEAESLYFFPQGDRVAISNESTGETRILPLDDLQGPPHRVLRGPAPSFGRVRFDPEGRYLAHGRHIWDLEGPPDAGPIVLGGDGNAFTPDARWLISSTGQAIDFWAVGGPLRRELPGQKAMTSLAFTADGRWLAACPGVEPLRLLPLHAADGGARLLGQPKMCFSVATHPTEDLVLESTQGVNIGRHATVLLHSLAAPSRELPGGWGWPPWALTFDATGRRALASALSLENLWNPASRILRAWDLASGREHVYSVARLTDADWKGFLTLSVAPDGTLYGGGQGGVRKLLLPEAPDEAVESETVYAAAFAVGSLSRDGHQLLVAAAKEMRPFPMLLEELVLLDLERGTSRRITTHGAQISGFLLSPSGQVILTASPDGTLRVGPATGGEPHLLLGHEGRITALAISPDERWIASASADAFYVWPMPDVTKAPLHTLPHEELLAKLDTLTNLRVVRDAESSTGWKLDIGPFPGWKDVPTW
jgi:WD40 repeat protein